MMHTNPKQSIDVKKIDGLITATAAAAAEKALAGDEAGLLHQTAILDGLKAIREAAAPPSAPPRWPPAAIFIVTALLLAYLLGKPETAGISFDVSTRAIDVSLSAGTMQQEYMYFSTSRIPVSAVHVEGVASSFPTDVPMVRSPGGASLTSHQWKALVVEEIHVAVQTGEDARLSVTTYVGNLRICASSQLVVQARGVRNASPDDELAVVLNVSPPSGKPTPAGPVDRRACFTLAIDEGSTFSVTTQLPVRDVSVSGPAAAPQGTDPRAILFPTTLVSGKLTFPEVPSIQYEFGADDRLGLVGAQGLLRKVDWKKDQLVLSFRGTATAATRSSGQVEQQLIPSRMSYLRASQSDLILAWGVLLYLFGLALSVYKWIGGRK